MTGSGLDAASAYAIGLAFGDASFLDAPITRGSSRSVWSLATHEDCLGFPPLVAAIPNRSARVAAVVAWLTLPWRPCLPDEAPAVYQKRCELRVVVRVSIYREALARVCAGVDRHGKPTAYAPEEVAAANAALWALERWAQRLATEDGSATVANDPAGAECPGF